MATFQALEIDHRLLGLIVATLAILGRSSTSCRRACSSRPRNLWNLSVQSAAIAIIATGMVLVIVSRNIDLSVGSLAGFIGHGLALTETDWISTTIGLGVDYPFRWVIALAVRARPRRPRRRWARGSSSPTSACRRSSSRWAVSWSGAASSFQCPGRRRSRAVDPGLPAARRRAERLDRRAPELGSRRHRLVAIVCACAPTADGSVGRYGFPLRPMWAEVLLAVVGCRHDRAWGSQQLSVAQQPGLAVRPGAKIPSRGRPDHPDGIANPILIVIGVTLVMTFIATRRRFGRYVYASAATPTRPSSPASTRAGRS